jgi:predicted metal-dependent HD superfamily phosphohydrolase
VPAFVCQTPGVPVPDERWTAALTAIGATRGDPGAVFADLTSRYNAPGRHHHCLGHASSVVDTVLGIHRDGDAWATVVLAAWFHDAVYDATASSGHNEGASAVLAVRQLGTLGAASSHIGEVARLVCLTVDHDPDPSDAAGALLTDADLCILAAPEARYDRYVREVRAEYAHVADHDWRIGRLAVLRQFIDRPSIFRTLLGCDQWERGARSNISRELESLSR